MSLVPDSAAGGPLSVAGDQAPRWWSTRHRVRTHWPLGAADVSRFHREIHFPAGFFQGIPRGQQVQFRHLKLVTDLDGITTDRGPAATKNSGQLGDRHLRRYQCRPRLRHDVRQWLLLTGNNRFNNISSTTCNPLRTNHENSIQIIV